MVSSKVRRCAGVVAVVTVLTELSPPRRGLESDGVIAAAASLWRRQERGCSTRMWSHPAASTVANKQVGGSGTNENDNFLLADAARDEFSLGRAFTLNAGL